VERKYPATWLGDNRPEFSILGTDYIFTCPARSFASLFKKWAPDVPLYLYQWNHPVSWDAWGWRYSFCSGKVCHASELPFEFDAPALSKFGSPTPEEKHLMSEFGKYWTNFAKTSNPNQGEQVEVQWQSWAPNNLRNLNFNLTITHNVALLNDTCNFWDGLGYHWGW